MGERQTKHTKTENRKKTKESRTHHPKQNSSNVLSVSLLDQVYRLMVIRKGVFLCFLSKLAIPERMLPEQTELTIPRGWKAGEELPEQTNWRYLAKRCLSRQNWPFHPRGRP